MAKKQHRFRVLVRQRMWQLGVVAVTAADEDEAWEKGLEAAKKDIGVHWDRGSIHVDETEDDFIEVEEVEDDA